VEEADRLRLAALRRISKKRLRAIFLAYKEQTKAREQAKEPPGSAEPGGLAMSPADRS
jgi:hypothetical protein